MNARRPQVAGASAARPTRRGLLAAGAAGGVALAVTACGGGGSERAGAVPALRGRGDERILQFALLLEFLESDFYDAVVASGLLRGRTLEIARRFGENEQEHVDALTAAIQQLGGTPPGKPRTRFVLEEPGAVLRQAAGIEALGASAYLGAAPLIEDPQVLGAALAIHSVEARHAAALNRLLGRPVVGRSPFVKPAAVEDVLRQVAQYLEPV